MAWKIFIGNRPLFPGRCPIHGSEYAYVKQWDGIARVCRKCQSEREKLKDLKKQIDEITRRAAEYK
jgi:hypothetical protein